MNKWLLLAVGTAAAAAFFLHLLSSSLDVSSDPAYSKIVGKRLLTLKDLYLIDFGAGADPSLGDSGCISDDLPPEVLPGNAGKTFGAVTVAGVVPRGSVVAVVGVKKNINTEAEFKGRIESTGQDVDLSFIQDYSGVNGDFKGGFVEVLN